MFEKELSDIARPRQLKHESPAPLVKDFGFDPVFIVILLIVTFANSALIELEAPGFSKRT